MLFVQFGNAILKARGFVRIAGHLALVRQYREQFRPVASLLVKDVQTRESLQIVRIELQNLRICIDRARNVAELALVDCAYLIINSLFLLDVVDEIGLLRIYGQKVVPKREVQVSAYEGIDGSKIVGIDLQDFVVHGNRRLRTTENVFLDSRSLEESGLLLLRIFEDFRFLLQNRGKLLIALRYAEQPFERFGRRQAQRIDLEHFAVKENRGI